MSKILGKDVILYIAINASPQILQPIGCARTCVLTTSATTAGISTLGSGIFQEFKALSINWNVSVDGLATFGENMGIGTLRGYQFALQPILIVFKESTASVDIEYIGYAIITSVSSTGNYADVETYSVQLQGTGQLQNSGSLRITDIQIDVPMAGETTLTFGFDTFPNATAYTIRIRDITANTITNDTAGAAPRTEIINSTHDYAFSYRPEYLSGPGDFSPEIFYP